MRLLVTGGLGFIESNFINYWISKYPNDQIVNVNMVTYASNLDNIQQPNNPNYRFVKTDINDKK